MFFSEQLFCQLLCQWLTPTDLVILHTASSRALHDELTLLTKSVKFRECFTPQFEALLQASSFFWPVLNWLRRTGANIANVSVNITPPLLRNMSVVHSTLPLSFVTTVHLYGTSASHWHFVRRLFPALQKLCIGVHHTAQDDSSSVLSFVAEIAHHCPLSDIQIVFRSSTGARFALSRDAVRIVCGIFRTLNRTLRVFAINCRHVPIALLDALAKSCPNATEVFPTSRFHPSLTAAQYLASCAQLQNLDSLILTSQCGFSLADTLLIPAIEQLPKLRVFSLQAGHELKVASVLAVLRCCPAIETIFFLDEFEVSITRCNGIATKSTLKVEFFPSVITDAVDFTTFLGLLPGLNQLIVEGSMSNETSSLVFEPFVVSGVSKHIESFALNCGGEEFPFGALVCWLEHFPSLRNLSLLSLRHARFNGGGFASFVSALALRCPLLRNLALHHPLFLYNKALRLIIDTLPALEKFEIVLNEGENCLLTPDDALEHLARPNKIWNCLALPQRVCFSPEKLLEVVSNGTLRAKELLFSNHSGSLRFRSPFGVVTATAVKLFLERELMSMKSWDKKHS